ncbi:MAG: type II toxin-antitoxin system RelE/ParE family toxin [Gemmatimonadaceae bacterium]|nr:type II toxin-antitoxin system RelE/ParE family toxin [Gemmatimonadaceae bacterium]
MAAQPGSIKTLQFGWPLGVPLVRKLESDLWEVRSTLPNSIARVVFTVYDGTILLLHGFIKKSQKTPPAIWLWHDPDWRFSGGTMKGHVGSSFDEFLAEEGLLSEAEATAVKRVIAYQLCQFMEENKLSKSAMARRMRTSRSALDRLLDSSNPSVTLQTMDRAARALGKKLRIELT